MQVTVDEWVRFLKAAGKDYRHYVSLSVRPGALAMMATVEYNLFPPRSAFNQMFHVHSLMWEWMPLQVFSVPYLAEGQVKAIAKALGMRIADGVPTLVEHGKPPIHFPGGNNVFTLENDEGSPIYRNRQRDNDAVIEREGELLTCYEQGELPSLENVREFLWGPGQLKSKA
jgi:hypothetical protein